MITAPSRGTKMLVSFVGFVGVKLTPGRGAESEKPPLKSLADTYDLAPHAGGLSPLR